MARLLREHGACVLSETRDWAALSTDDDRWLEETQHYTPLQCCIAGRQWRSARMLLTRDPPEQPTGLPSDPTVIPAGTPGLLQLAHSGPRPPCEQTLTVAALASSGWCPRAHSLFPAGFRRLVHFMLLVAARRSPTVQLPFELWIHVFSFIPRSARLMEPVPQSEDEQEKAEAGKKKTTKKNKK